MLLAWKWDGLYLWLFRNKRRLRPERTFERSFLWKICATAYRLVRLIPIRQIQIRFHQWDARFLGYLRQRYESFLCIATNDIISPILGVHSETSHFISLQKNETKIIIFKKFHKILIARRNNQGSFEEMALNTYFSI